MRRAGLLLVGLAVGCGRVGFDDQAGDQPGADAPPAIAPLTELAPVPAIAASDSSTCALLATGDLWCWGGNWGGELGVGDWDPRPLPVRIGEPGAWRRVTAGGYHACAVGELGDVWCWGSNGGASELGVGDYTSRLAPTRVTVPGTVVTISAGSSSTQALTTSGSRWAWGENRGEGVLGLGTTIGPVVLPVPALGDRWAAITTGQSLSCGLDVDGALWCWGVGGIGVGDSGSYFSPVPIMAAARWTAVSAYSHACAIRDDATLWCWGENNRGELGDGTTTPALTPIPIGPGQTWRALATGLYATCAIRTEGSLWCTGANDAGQLGVGDRMDRRVLTEVMPGTRWQAVAISSWFGHACGIQEDGAIYCWGEGADGQLGQGADLSSHLTPVRVAIP